MSINQPIIAPLYSSNNYSAKAKRHQNNIQKEKYNSSPVKYLAGATILASAIAIGIIYHKTNFKNIEDATLRFKQNFGTDADFTKCKDPEYIKAINNVLLELKKMDCKLPKTIDFCSFKDNSINIARNKYNLAPYTVPTKAHAHADSGHVFFNTDAPPLNNIVDKINRENLGHFKSLSPDHQIIKEYIATHEFGHVNANPSVLDYGFKSKYGELPNNAVDNLLENIAKYQNEMYTEVKPFNKSIEVIPETFAKLIMNPKLEFSDKTMLLYDIMGGGAIPNRKIKGMAYDEYMRGLYSHWQEILT